MKQEHVENYQRMEKKRREDALLTEALQRGFEQHEYVGIGHLMHPDDVVDCCPYGVGHPIHFQPPRCYQ